MSPAPLAHALGWDGYLGPTSTFGAKGKGGPLGAAGAAGSPLVPWSPLLGVVAPSDLVSGPLSPPFGWRLLSLALERMAGPNSALGPLGRRGPLARQAQGSSPLALRAGGVAMNVGQAGDLGALGPLGPGGPVGTHGLRADDRGAYKDAAGRVVTKIRVPHGPGDTKTLRLFEVYRGAAGGPYARRQQDQDPSFMVRDHLAVGAHHDYPIRVEQNELVTVSIFPEEGPSIFHYWDHAKAGRGEDPRDLFAAFGVEVLDAKDGRVVGRANVDGPNWLSITAPPGDYVVRATCLEAPGETEPFIPQFYRLAVVGTGDFTDELLAGAPWPEGPAKAIGSSVETARLVARALGGAGPSER
ncbi:hypothetical protein L6R52_39295 [Myxococcota bacterium]|nr:hypothetical protein [Myxococcota bacterium]